MTVPHPNHPFDPCDCPDRHRIEGRCVLHAPTVADIVHAVMTDINIAADKATVEWNNSHEAKVLGIHIGYSTQPLMELHVVPREGKASPRMFRSHMESVEVTPHDED